MAARDLRSDRKRQMLEKHGRKTKNSAKKSSGPKGARSGKFYMDVYRDTQEYFQTHPRPLRPGWVVTPADFKIDLAPSTESPPLEIGNEDTLAMARRYVAAGHKVLVLNMASAFKPGGGVAHGKTAQEESLFQRTNAFQTHPPGVYPLQPDQAIYSPEVDVIKDETFELLPVRDQYTVGMISVPAIKNPKTVGEAYLDSADRVRMSAKIELIFECGIAHGYQALVLGALGCGIYNNPPGEVAVLFKATLQRYGAAFEQIGFAILKVGRNGPGNYKIFRKVLL